MVNVRWAGIAKNGSKRIWGYFSVTSELTYPDLPQHYIFWGKKDGKLSFRSFTIDRAFGKMFHEKRKRYDSFDYEETLSTEFGQYRLVQKLKRGF